MSAAEQRYQAVMAVISEGRTITQVARDWGVSRQTMHTWLARYEAGGMEGLANLSHRPAHCPHQIASAVEVQLLEMRRARPYWGARRLAFELRRKGVVLVDDEEIQDSIVWALGRLKLLTEGAAAATLAALKKGLMKAAPGSRVVCVLSGGNLDTTQFASVKVN